MKNKCPEDSVSYFITHINGSLYKACERHNSYEFELGECVHTVKEHGNFRGTLIECETWIRLKEKGQI